MSSQWRFERCLCTTALTGAWKSSSGGKTSSVVNPTPTHISRLDTHAHTHTHTHTNLYTSCCSRPSWRSSSVCSWSSPPSTQQTTRSSCCSPESSKWSTHRTLKDNKQVDKTKEVHSFSFNNHSHVSTRVWRVKTNECVCLLICPALSSLLLMRLLQGHI